MSFVRLSIFYLPKIDNDSTISLICYFHLLPIPYHIELVKKQICLFSFCFISFGYEQIFLHYNQDFIIDLFLHNKISVKTKRAPYGAPPIQRLGQNPLLLYLFLKLAA